MDMFGHLSTLTKYVGKVFDYCDIWEAGADCTILAGKAGGQIFGLASEMISMLTYCEKTTYYQPYC